MHKLAKLTFALSTAGAVLLYCVNSHTAIKDDTAKVYSASGHSAILLAAEPDDPGKDITPDPHGSDPHDENHDADLPANNPDKYLPKK
jgi:hypothetical protein